MHKVCRVGRKLDKRTGRKIVDRRNDIFGLPRETDVVAPEIEERRARTSRFSGGDVEAGVRETDREVALRSVGLREDVGEIQDTDVFGHKVPKGSDGLLVTSCLGREKVSSRGKRLPKSVGQSQADSVFRPPGGG